MEKTIIIPILKLNKTSDNIDNYRPISLTSHITKVMERMISERLNWFLESWKLISPRQAAFRKYRSTSEQVIHLSQDLKDAFNRKENTLAVL